MLPSEVASANQIQIIGGGLAGLALGIRLRQRGVPAIIWEASRYPRHRVCGEVLSGRGSEILDHLQLLKPVLAAGGCWARTVAFYSDSRRTRVWSLPKPALCISRYALDQLLAERFCDLGGEIRFERWRGTEFPPGTVRASGRQVQVLDGAFRWFGMKGHAQNVRLQADIEMHLLKDGYVGLCRLSEGKVNVCGLFRSSVERRYGASQEEWLRGPPGSLLHTRLADPKWDRASFCAVAGLALRPRRAREIGECRLGDALTMISPVTGNGMSMAMEAAECSAEALAQFSFGELSWPMTQAQVARNCDAQFGRRLRSGWWLHRALFLPGVRLALLALGQSRWACDALFNLTR